MNTEKEHKNVNNNRQGSGFNHIVFLGRDNEKPDERADHVNNLGIEILKHTDDHFYFLDSNEFTIEVFICDWISDKEKVEMNWLSALFIGLLASELSLEDRLIGKWDFAYRDIHKSQTLQRDLNMACIETFLPENKMRSVDNSRWCMLPSFCLVFALKIVKSNLHPVGLEPAAPDIIPSRGT